MRKAVGGCWMAGVLATMALAGTAAATVTATASRTDALYTSDDKFDCGKLARSVDDDLPYNVIRIRAEDDTGQATSYSWKLPKPNVGYLLRDDPEFDSSAGGSFAIQGFCADVGNGCILTKESIGTYHLPSILYAGPKCDALPKNTGTQFGGDTVRIRVKADGQRGKAAKAAVDAGYGRLGTPVLWLSDLSGDPGNGIGRDVLPVGVDPTFSVTLEPGIMPPSPIKEAYFDNGGGRKGTATGCVLGGAAPGALACTVLEYQTPARFTPFVEVRLEDDSAYCDNATCRVVKCQPRTSLVADRSPRRHTYRSGDGTPEQLTLTLRNLASRHDGCPFILRELSCNMEAKLGSFDEQENVTFQPARCEGNDAIFCTNDLDCGSAAPCLNKSHCSTTTDQLCTADIECSTRQCPLCEDGEKCIRVIKVPPTIYPGESAVLIDETVDITSRLRGAAKITETWSATERFDRGNASTTERFKIRGPSK
jgi:hypothetical protein